MTLHEDGGDVKQVSVLSFLSQQGPIPTGRQARVAGTPKHRQIADELRGQVNRGELAPGARLPSEAELCQEYGASRTTVRAALATLANEGLIESESGRGSFVRQRRHLVYRPQEEFRPRPVSPEMDQFMTERASEGRKPSQTIDVAIVTPPADVAQRLHLAEGAPAVVRRRVRSLDGAPYYINDSYFPLDLVSGSEIMSPTDITRGANKVLAALGHDQVRALDEVYVRMPTPDEVHRLALGPGTPVALHVVTGFTADGQPVRVALNVLPGDRHAIVWERERPAATSDVDE
jgi:DNA-binding GntR family transcriptional regulator